ncbi:MAG: CRISPR-associated ring nuclease Csm6 [Pseudomonadota bacterium]
MLLAITGLSPQVITETLYALNQMNRPVHTIHVITTRLGKDRLLSELLDGGNGPYYRYLKMYCVPAEGVDFGPGNIHVVRDAEGAEIDDITDESGNTRVLGRCMELAFHFTRDPDSAVFFSIAGGRKTMGACLTLAAQMYGRPQDRLYHVLVSPEFESSRRFFFPPLEPEIIELRNASGELYHKSTRYARINLVHMPFFSIRAQLSPEILDHPRDPATLMLSLIRETTERLVVNLNEGKIRYRGAELDLNASRMALYAFFALLKKNCPEPGAVCKTCDRCFLGADEVSSRQTEISALYRRLSGSRPVEEMSKTGILGLDFENFRSYKARIKEDLTRAFGPMALEKLAIASHGKRPNMRYGLRMDKGAIEVVM